MNDRLSLFNNTYISIKYVGLRCTLKELLRRVTKKKYSCKSIPISSDQDFRALRDLSRAGIRLEQVHPMVHLKYRIIK